MLYLISFIQRQYPRTRSAPGSMNLMSRPRKQQRRSSRRHVHGRTEPIFIVQQPLTPCCGFQHLRFTQQYYPVTFVDEDPGYSQDYEDIYEEEEDDGEESSPICSRRQDPYARKQYTDPYAHPQEQIDPRSSLRPYSGRWSSKQTTKSHPRFPHATSSTGNVSAGMNIIIS